MRCQYNWKQAHPEAAVPAEIHAHKNTQDMSWGNDACPSFELIDDEGTITGHHLWVDYEVVAMRDHTECKRYAILHIEGDDEAIDDLITDDLNQVLAFISSLQGVTS